MITRVFAGLDGEIGEKDLENKGIVLKLAWFVRPDINMGTTII